MKKYLAKQMKIRDENLKYDFLPSMMEVIERPANPLGAIIIFIIIIAIVSAVIWSALFKIDIVISGTGSISPKGGLLPIEFRSDGVVSEVMVSNNSEVSKGDLLVVLDDSSARRDLKSLQYTLGVYETQHQVYSALYSFLDSYSDDWNSIGDWVIDFDTSMEYASFVDEIMLQYKIFEINYFEADESYTEGMYISEKASILQAINNLELYINNTKKDIESISQTINDCFLYAQSDGIVTFLDTIFEGVSVSQGKPIGYLNPIDNQRIMQAFLADDDIGFINIGDTVNIKISAFDDSEYEYLHGRVLEIGDVGTNVDSIGSVYTITVEIDDLPSDNKVGMEGVVDVIIGQRSVLDYFLDPFIEGLQNSLREK